MCCCHCQVVQEVSGLCSRHRPGGQVVLKQWVVLRVEVSWGWWLWWWG
jgi:hypothetical protein